MKKITAAIAGNPNSGKTTLFNALTGARQHVGNYPGVTVEKKEGSRIYKDCQINFIDLPGTYSLTAHSIEEVVARDYIINENPDVVVNIIDASNFERNLYLATQLLELNVPLILVLNMADVAKKQGYSFDTEKLGSFFNARAILTVASKSEGINELLDSIIEKSQIQTEQTPSPLQIHYGEDIEREIDKLEKLVDKKHPFAKKYGARWLCLKLLEKDEQIIGLSQNREILNAAEQSISHLEKLYGDSPEILIAEKRYGFVSGVYEGAVVHTVQHRHQISDLVDKVLLNRVLGLPIFIIMMYLVFKLTFWIGAHPMVWIETGFAYLSNFISGLWPQGSENAVKSLIVDGIIGGVGGVVVFLPNIVLLFLAIAILEDSGYMARAAFLMDRIMKKIGLHGRSFIPMVIGFGCTVPAIMATRILDDRKSRLTTIMVLPLMSCGARLPIYTLFISAFFAVRWHAMVMLIVYMIGILIAIILSLLLRKTLLKGESGIFLMELPPYRMPTIRGMLTHAWERSWLYLKKAGTVILAISIVLWFMTTYPKASEEKLSGLSEQDIQKAQLQNSIAGRVGLAMEPAIKPLGFDYRIGTALIGALAAKEVFVAQTGIVFSISDSSGEESLTLREKLRANYTPLQGFCVMLFCLISAPCAATLAICRKETNSWGWALFQYLGLTAIGYTVTLIVYQTGSLFLG
ncbi:Ferrous iron transport protein B [Limihaloglobus sulfuriphilus]|uniref:Ferrous iron transport protein B n=1 Tax=Limihaloglobus sulfuriphilus TaxID=1851148 RepID=A0A1Q2MDX2_9BACT|nr:ferrous iron transport protein B [Limihaloglobus sulfuriphilus]AQQ70901.1 Ferrous iron transport protein B [Limihaloglobus sulfuriphilus]